MMKSQRIRVSGLVMLGRGSGGLSLGHFSALFVLVDGWSLVAGSLVQSYGG
jgi:flagellar biosynthesis protein FliP